LSNIISKLSDDIKGYSNSDVVIYVTNNDKAKYSDFIKSELSKKISNNITFKATESIIGGLVAEFTEKNIKIDMSMDAVLEDNKTYIMQTIFETLEAGDYNG
jgi:vacuolar-type H+-ATPase subunit E/Vma4